MAKLKNINGYFVESDYENVLLAFLEREGWEYLFGDSITRANRKEVLREALPNATFVGFTGTPIAETYQILEMK